MGGLIIACIALAVVCLFLLAQKVLLNHRIRKLAEQVDGFNSGTAEMLDVALEEDRLAQLHNGIADLQLSLTKISFSVHIYAIQILAVLAEWKKQQTLLHFGQGIPLNGFCFTQDNGEMMHPQAPTSYLIRFGKRYNLPGIHPHALRHTMATLSIANGADVVSISEKLGHAEPSITLNVYSHANEEAQRRANAVLAEALYSKTKQA